MKAECEQGEKCVEVALLTQSYKNIESQMKDNFQRIEDSQKIQRDSLVEISNKIDRNHSESLRMIESHRKEMFENIEKQSQKNDETYVKKEQFSNVKNIVYAAVGMILIAFFTSVIAQFINK